MITAGILLCPPLILTLAGKSHLFLLKCYCKLKELHHGSFCVFRSEQVMHKPIFIS